MTSTPAFGSATSGCTFLAVEGAGSCAIAPAVPAQHTSTRTHHPFLSLPSPSPCTLPHCIRTWDLPDSCEAARPEVVAREAVVRPSRSATPPSALSGFRREAASAACSSPRDSTVVLLKRPSTRGSDWDRSHALSAPLILLLSTKYSQPRAYWVDAPPRAAPSFWPPIDHAASC